MATNSPLDPGVYINVYHFTTIKIWPQIVKNTPTKRKLPRSQPDPFPDLGLDRYPEISKLWPCNRIFVVARSSLGIPDSPGCPAHPIYPDTSTSIFVAGLVQCLSPLQFADSGM